MNTIDWAVIPVAGMGTRMLPMSKASPKELLPLIDKPLIDWILDEVYLAGIKNVVLVTHPDKISIESYLTRNLMLENALLEKGKQDLVDILKETHSKDINIVFTNQLEPLGLGHAINCARSIIDGKGFAVLLPDVILTQTTESKVGNTLALMVEQTARNGHSSILVEHIPIEKTSSYGIVALKQDQKTIASMVEKPQPEDAPSDLAIVGRYVFTPGIWQFLDSTETGSGGEIQLTDAIDKLLAKECVETAVLNERSFDCGDKLGYLHANIELALNSAKYGMPLKGRLKN